MIAAVIDLGTNTFHLIIAEISANDFQIIYRTNLPVKLGEGRINENIIIPEAFERGISALKSFKEQIDKYKVDRISAIATSAIRSAGNGKDFVDAVLRETSIVIETIDGNREADYIYKGVSATGLIDQTSLIIDIGGGSTEFILCDPIKPLWKKSYNIGAARLQQAYFKSDPISESDQHDIMERLDTELTDLKAACQLYKPTQLIGSAGAFETFAEMLHEGLVVKEIISSVIDINLYKELSLRFINSTHEERRHFKGLIPLRVDMIVIAAILTNYILGISTFEKMSVSAYDLKIGVLNDMKPN